MQTLRHFGYGISVGPLPVVVWFGLAALALLFAAALIAGMKRQVPLFRKVSIRGHRAIALVGFVLALAHHVLGLSSYV